jgi:hypothetical protein
VAKHRKVHLFDIDIPGRQTFKVSQERGAGSEKRRATRPQWRVRTVHSVHNVKAFRRTVLPSPRVFLRGRHQDNTVIAIADVAAADTHAGVRLAHWRLNPHHIRSAVWQDRSRDLLRRPIPRDGHGCRSSRWVQVFIHSLSPWPIALCPSPNTRCPADLRSRWLHDDLNRTAR